MDESFRTIFRVVSVIYRRCKKSYCIMQILQRLAHTFMNWEMDEDAKTRFNQLCLRVWRMVEEVPETKRMQHQVFH